MVTIVTPGNPSGAVIPQERLQELTKICGDNNIWLVSDETYEYFTYGDAVHRYCVAYVLLMCCLCFAYVLLMCCLCVANCTYGDAVHRSRTKK